MAHAKNHDYHILPPSIWPLLSAVSAFLMLFGAILWMNERPMFLFLAGFIGVLICMFGWWRDVVKESNGGEHSKAIRIGLRMGFIMFVISEVFFFLAWFWAFFKFKIFPMENMTEMSGLTQIDTWHLPLINTLILLLSGTFVTEAHREIAHGNADNSRIARLLGYAIVLGLLFTGLQVFEYYEAIVHYGFFMDGHPYRSTFFLATMFHGFHVIVGTIFLFVCMLRARRNEFTEEAHVGFEAAAWYWHFVDVVWIFLFFAVYIWGNNIIGG